MLLISLAICLSHQQTTNVWACCTPHGMAWLIRPTHPTDLSAVWLPVCFILLQRPHSLASSVPCFPIFAIILSPLPLLQSLWPPCAPLRCLFLVVVLLLSSRGVAEPNTTFQCSPPGTAAAALHCCPHDHSDRPLQCGRPAPPPSSTAPRDQTCSLSPSPPSVIRRHGHHRRRRRH